MHIVGTDEISVAGGRTVPAGRRHAVDDHGRVLCRTARARFSWPGLAWSGAADADEACPLCVQAHRSQQHQPAPSHEAYPLAYAAVAPFGPYPSVPAQPVAEVELEAGDSVA